MIRNGMQGETGTRSAAGSTQTLPKAVLIAAVGLTLGLVTLMLSTIAGLQLGNTLLRPSPFIAYQAIWPGQSLDSVKVFARSLPDSSIFCTSAVAPVPNGPYASAPVYRIPSDIVPESGVVCSYSPASGLFRWVTLRIENTRITQLELISDVLPEDVLLLYWGMPDAISRMGSDQRLNLFWEQRSYHAMATVMEASSVVRIVTLTLSA